MGFIETATNVFKKPLKIFIKRGEEKVELDKTQKISLEKKETEEKIVKTEEELLKSLIKIRKKITKIINKETGEDIEPDGLNKKLGNYIGYFNEMIKIQKKSLEDLKQKNPSLREESIREFQPHKYYTELKEVKTGISLKELRKKYNIKHPRLLKKITKEIDKERKLFNELIDLREKRLQNV